MKTVLRHQKNIVSILTLWLLQFYRNLTVAWLSSKQALEPRNWARKVDKKPLIMYISEVVCNTLPLN